MYYRWEGAIRQKDCESVIAEYKDYELRGGTVVNGKHEVRRASICWIDASHLIYRAVKSFMNEANSIFFNYDIGESEKLQFAKYEVGGKYGWHKDELPSQNNTIRKLSTIVQLSSPDDYEGGELEMFNGDEDLEDLNIKKQGSVIVFDSRDWHRLTPVTSGVRYSLASWSLGRRFS